MVASRATDKITPVNDKIVVCRSGSAADTQAISDIINFYVESYESILSFLIFYIKFLII